jgi:hypothetical protein
MLGTTDVLQRYIHPIDVYVAVGNGALGRNSQGFPAVIDGSIQRNGFSLSLPLMAWISKLVVYPPKCLVSIEWWQSRDRQRLEADHSS